MSERTIINIEYEYEKRRVCDQCLARDSLSFFFLIFISSDVGDEEEEKERGREIERERKIKSNKTNK